MPRPLLVPQALLVAIPLPALLLIATALAPPTNLPPGTRWTTYLSSSLALALVAAAAGALALHTAHQRHLTRPVCVGALPAAPVTKVVAPDEAGAPTRELQLDSGTEPALRAPQAGKAAVLRRVPFGVVNGVACLWIAGVAVYGVWAEGRFGCWMRTQGEFANGTVVTTGWERYAC